jgi:hypothetical protein
MILLRKGCDDVFSITTHKNDQISFKILELEKNENHPDYLSIRVNVVSDGFTGISDFWLGKNDLIEFVNELEHFDKSLKGSPILTCGWDDVKYFEISFVLMDNQGHIMIKMIIANPVCFGQELRGNGKLMNQVFLISEIEVNELAKFIKLFKSLIQ